MTDGALKLARDLKAGDRVIVALKDTHNRQEPMTVVDVVPSVQTITRKVLIVTLRTADGTEQDHVMHEHRSVRMAT